MIIIFASGLIQSLYAVEVNVETGPDRGPVEGPGEHGEPKGPGDVLRPTPAEIAEAQRQLEEMETGRFESLDAWQQEWEALIKQQGVLSVLGWGASKMSGMSDPQKAQILIQIIKDTPITQMMADPAQGMTVITDIAQIALAELAANSSAYKDVMSELLKRATPVLSGEVERAVNTDGPAVLLASRGLVGPDGLFKYLTSTDRAALATTFVSALAVSHVAEPLSTNTLARLQALADIATYRGDLWGADKLKSSLNAAFKQVNDEVISAVQRNNALRELTKDGATLNTTTPEEYKAYYTQELKFLEPYYTFLAQNTKLDPSAFTPARLAVARRLAEISVLGKDYQPRMLSAVVNDLKTNDEPSYNAYQLQKKIAPGSIKLTPTDEILLMSSQLSALVATLQGTSLASMAPTLIKMNELVQSMSAPRKEFNNESLIELMSTSQQDVIFAERDAALINAAKLVEPSVRQLSQGLQKGESLAQSYEVLQAIYDLLNRGRIARNTDVGIVQGMIKRMVRGEFALLSKPRNATLGESGEKAREMSNEELAQLGPEIDAMIKDLSVLYQGITLDEALSQEIGREIRELYVWKSMSDLASKVPDMMASPEGTALKDGVLAFGEISEMLPLNIDYRNLSDFNERLKLMRRQHNTTATLNHLFNQSIVVAKTPTTWRELGKRLIESGSFLGKPLDQDEEDALDNLGLISLASARQIKDARTRRPSGTPDPSKPGPQLPEATITSMPSGKGVALTELARQMAVNERRVRQFDDFIKKGDLFIQDNANDPSKAKAGPSLVMEYNGQRIPLAETLGLNHMILDDQLSKLKQVYSWGILVNTDPVVRELADIQSLLAGQPARASAAQKPIPDLVPGMQKDKNGNPTPTTEWQRDLINDMQSILAANRPALRDGKYEYADNFEGLVALRRRALDARVSETERKAAQEGIGVTDMMNRILLLDDAAAVTRMIPATMIGENFTIFSGLNNWMGTAFTSFFVSFDKSIMRLRMTASTAAAIAVVTSAIATYWASGAAVNSMPWLFGSLGVMISPVGSLGAWVVGSITAATVGPFIKIASALGVAGALAVISHKIMVTQPEIDAFNAKMTSLGFDPVDFTAQKTLLGWAEAKKDSYVQAFNDAFKDQVAYDINALAMRREAINNRETNFVNARTALYKELGLPANATTDDVALALKIWKGKTKDSWAMSRLLKENEFNRLYRAMLRRGKEVAEGYMDYNREANAVLIKHMGLIPDATTNELYQFLSTQGGALGMLGDAILQKHGDEVPGHETPITKADINKLENGIIENYLNQLGGLEALKALYRNPAINLNSASLFADNGLLQKYTTLMDGQMGRTTDYFGRQFAAYQAWMKSNL